MALPRLVMLAALAITALASAGCSTAIVEPGHRGLLFAPSDGGLRHEVLPPGRYTLGACFVACTANRIDDFDVTYSTRAEHLHAHSYEGLDVDVTFSVVYRPVIAELYQLDTEIGQKYYDEVVGPEARSVGRQVIARHAYYDMTKGIEDEIETDLRRRITGRHIELAAVTVESVSYAPEIAEKIRQKIAAWQDAERQRAAIEAEFAIQKLRAEHEAELRKIVSPPVCTPLTGR